MDYFHQVSLRIVTMITKDFCPNFFARPAIRNLNDPTIVPSNSNAEVGYVRNFNFQFMMIGIGGGDKTFGFSIHATCFVTGSPLVGKTLFLGIDEPNY